MATHGGETTYGTGFREKPCRTCTDFKSWTKMQNKSFNIGTDSSEKEQNTSQQLKDCPLDKDDLGKNTWGFLHTMAAYYPSSPTTRQKADMSQFIKLFSQFYPCDHCAEDLRKQLEVTPPNTKSQEELSQWLCRIHNNINRRLGKREFDCSRVNERWRDGWKDGSCD